MLLLLLLQVADPCRVRLQTFPYMAGSAGSCTSPAMLLGSLLTKTIEWGFPKLTVQFNALWIVSFAFLLLHTTMHRQWWNSLSGYSG